MGWGSQSYSCHFCLCGTHFSLESYEKNNEESHHAGERLPSARAAQTLPFSFGQIRHRAAMRCRAVLGGAIPSVSTISRTATTSAFFVRKCLGLPGSVRIHGQRARRTSCRRGSAIQNPSLRQVLARIPYSGLSRLTETTCLPRPQTHSDGMTLPGKYPDRLGYPCEAQR